MGAHPSVKKEYSLVIGGQTNLVRKLPRREGNTDLHTSREVLTISGEKEEIARGKGTSLPPTTQKKDLGEKGKVTPFLKKRVGRKSTREDAPCGRKKKRKRKRALALQGNKRGGSLRRHHQKEDDLAVEKKGNREKKKTSPFEKKKNSAGEEWSSKKTPGGERKLFTRAFFQKKKSTH